MPFVDSTELSTREPLPGWTSRVFRSDNMAFAYYEIAASHSARALSACRAIVVDYPLRDD